MSIAIKGGRVFHNGAFSELDILLSDGKIAGIGKSISGDEHYDARGMLVLPGLIDPHVHLREPGATQKEDFRTGSMAAVAGGFTTVMDMPNNPTPTTTPERLREKMQLAKEKAVCDILFHFGATDSNFSEVKKSGARSLKIYLGKTTGELYLRDPASLEKHFAGFSGNFVFHASVAEGNEGAQIEKTCENIGRVGALGKKYKRKSHLAHASAKEEVAAAKKHGLTVETAPHYLFLSKKDAERLGKLGTVYPNLRNESLRKGLWEAIGQMDCIATDHAPHTLEDKEAGAHGFPGLETSLAIMLQAYWERKLTMEWIVSAMSEKPAEIFGLSGVGRITEGYDGDISVLDLKKEWTVKGEELYTKCRWSPFEGKTLKGRIKSVFHKGNPVFDDFSFMK